MTVALNSKAKDSAKLAGVTPTAAGLALLDDADAAAQRTTLGLGSSDNVTFGNVTGTANALVKLDQQSVGSPNFNAGRIRIGETEGGGEAEIYVAEDTSNPATRALFLTPPANSQRLHFGTSSKKFYSLNLANVINLESVPQLTDFSNRMLGADNSNCSVRNGNLGQRWNSSASSAGAYQWFGVSTGFTTIAGGAALLMDLDRDKSLGLSLFNATTSQSTYPASNVEALSLSWSSNVARIWTRKTGTGSVRDLVLGANATELIRLVGGGGIILTGLPTTDPGNTGQLWNDAGTLKVSAGS